MASASSLTLVFSYPRKGGWDVAGCRGVWLFRQSACRFCLPLPPPPPYTMSLIISHFSDCLQSNLMTHSKLKTKPTHAVRSLVVSLGCCSPWVSGSESRAVEGSGTWFLQLLLPCQMVGTSLVVPLLQCSSWWWEMQPLSAVQPKSQCLLVCFLRHQQPAGRVGDQRGGVQRHAGVPL